MKYKFPTIEHIDQVRDAIADVEGMGEVDKGKFIIFDYVVAFADTFPPVETDVDAIRRECRGITFDKETGEIIRRPFHKFFNVNERDETRMELIDVKQPHVVLHKYDGSMIAPVIVDGEILWGTRKIAQEFHELVAAHVARSDEDYVGLVEWCTKIGATPMFEFMSPDKQIVVEHKREELRLLAVRAMKSGNYFTQNMIENLHVRFNVPIAGQAFDSVDSLSDFIPFVRNLKDDREGVVIRFEDGHHVKLKTEQYTAAHRAKELLVDKDVVKMILHDTVDDIMPYIGIDDQKSVERFKDKICRGIRETAEEMFRFAGELRDNGMTVGEIANSDELKAYPHRMLVSVVMRAVRGASVDEIENSILIVLRKWTGSGPRVDSIRPVFGGHRFSDRGPSDEE
jgi:RNA ligase